MTTTLTTRDPVQGLVDYVLDVKPFHTKILEVWVEYIYNDPINATVKDKLDWEIYMDFDRMTGCGYGWDTSPWDTFWNVDDQSEIVTGTFRYTDGGTTKSIDKFDAYRLFFDYLTALWQSRFGRAIPPTNNDTSASNPFRILYLPLTSGPQVISECLKYWETNVLANVNVNSQFWLDTKTKRLYQLRNNDWNEQLNFYYTAVEPTDAVAGDFWYSISVNKLYIRVTTAGISSWSAINNIYVGYQAPAVGLTADAPPVYPELWKSNWDYPPCTGPQGENHVFAYVTDLLSFEHGTEIFLFDHVRTAVVDPTGRDSSYSEYTAHTQRKEHPIKWRTKVIQTSRNRYKLQREEISVVTEPNNPEIKNTTWTIDLNGYDFDGWDIERVRKDVKIGNYLAWRYTSGGTKLLQDTPINNQTFRFRVVSGNLVAQRTDTSALVDIPCPWAEGAIVYVRSTDDLPKYNLPSLDATKSLRLERYRPYRVVLKTGNAFSLAIADRETLELDTDAMGSTTSLTFSDAGSGRMYIGLGLPVPFMEVRQHYTDSIKANKFKEKLASPVEVFVGHELNKIIDIAINYTGTDGTSYTGFVVEGVYNFIKGQEFQVGGSPARANDGMWTTDKIVKYTNMFTAFSQTGVGTPSVKPVWWDVAKLGAWTQPTKKSQKEIDALVASGEYSGYASEYNFKTWTMVAVSDGIPEVTIAPHGFIAETSYNFDEGSGPNAAHTTIVDKLIFGSLRAIPQPDGTTKFEREVGVPGVSIVLKDRIKATVQEGLNRDDPYGGQTIGSYDGSYFDQDTYDENLDTIILRLGSQ